MPLTQQNRADGADGSPEQKSGGNQALPGTRIPSRGSEAQELAQHQTQVESRDVHQVTLRDVVSSSKAGSSMPARFKDVGEAPFDQFAALALQRFALGTIDPRPTARAVHQPPVSVNRRLPRCLRSGM